MINYKYVETFMSLSISQDFFNSSSLSSPFYPINNDASTGCELTAWIHSGHGFVEFNCGAMNKSIGFYPQDPLGNSGCSKQITGVSTVNYAALPILSSAA